MNTLNTCHICKKHEVKSLLNLGMQPVCNRFLKKPEEKEKEYKHSLILGRCRVCGLVQLINLFPITNLVPEYEWIVRYAEPEEHLDKLAHIITNLPGISNKSRFYGISFKDDSLLERMKKLGFTNAWRLDIKKDLDIKESLVGVETVQDKFNPEKAREIAEKQGKQDVIIARHILEHCYDAPRFMRALKEMLKPDGYIVVEVPGCNQALDLLDYTIIWEEHTIYFTNQTFKQIFDFTGFSLKYFEEVAYPLESSLIGIAQLKDSDKPFFPDKNVVDKEIRRAEVFAQGFEKTKEKLRNYLSKQNKVALFGAGHLACGFINFFELKDFFEFVVDDDPNKKGLFMPGSGLPIYGSNALIEKNIRLCLLSLNPRNEDKVIQKNQGFIKNKGTFLSIFPSSKHALKIGRINYC